MQEIASIRAALSADARSRARRDDLITQRLQELAVMSSGERRANDDITGRFHIAEANIIQKVQHKALPREFTINVSGTAVAIVVWKLIELYLSSKGH